MNAVSPDLADAVLVVVLLVCILSAVGASSTVPLLIGSGVGTTHLVTRWCGTRVSAGRTRSQARSPLPGPDTRPDTSPVVGPSPSSVRNESSPR